MKYLTPDIFEGKDRRLFLAGGTNEVLRCFSRSAEDMKPGLSSWAQQLRLRKHRAEELGARYRHVIIPDKLNTYREEADCNHLSLRFPSQELEDHSKEYGLIDILIPLTDYFRRQKHTYQMFWLTDTHFTIAGCYSAYQMICAYIQISPKVELITRHCSKIDRSLDLGGKLNPPRTEVLSVGRYGVGASRIFANELVTIREHKIVPNSVGLHNGSMVRYENSSPSAIDINLLVFGDSFFEYRTHLLTGMFAETVRYFTFVWSANIDWGLVSEYKPDVVLTECAERFIISVPDDSIDIAAHVNKKLAVLNLDKQVC
jgi:alginate O-acetyltransferase complex protein AlgJ